MGLFDEEFQDTKNNLAKEGTLDLEVFEGELLKELYEEDNRKPYRLREIGIDTKTVDETKVADLYAFDGETITVCPEPISFLKEYDEVSDRTELAQEKFREAIKKDERFKKIILNFQPKIRLKEQPNSKVWRNKTCNGINLRPGICESGKISYAPIKLGDENVHGLIVGRTGSGKSVFINALLMSLISEYAPWELDIYLADFKKVELSRYMNDDVGNDNTPFTPHMNACAATSEIRYVLSMFRYLAECMYARNEMFTRLGVTKLKEFREKYNLVLPRVLLIIDEFQQLFTEATARESEEIQTILNAITKLGRATGFHLIFASQEMSGTLRGNTLANFKIRMALPCNKEISNEYLGNSAAATLERGYVLINTDDGKEINNKKFKVPYIATETKKESDEKEPFYMYLDKIKKCGNVYRENLSYKYNTQKYYQEDLQEKEGQFGNDFEGDNGYLNDLWKIRKRKNELIDKHDQFFDAIVLGKTVVYSNRKNDKSSFYIEYGRNRGIMIASPYPDDVAKIRKLLTSNLVLSNDRITHLGVELNGLIYNRFQMEKYIRKIKEKNKISSQNYYNFNSDEGFQYLYTVYQMRKNALLYLKDMRNAETFKRAQDCFCELENALQDKEAVYIYKNKRSQLSELEDELYLEQEQLKKYNLSKHQGSVNPLVLYLEKLNMELVTSPEEPKEDHLVNIAKLDIYKEIISKCECYIDIELLIQEVVERMNVDMHERMNKLNSLSLEMQEKEKIILVRTKCLVNALEYYCACYCERELPDSKQRNIFESICAELRDSMREYRVSYSNSLLENKKIEKCKERIDEILRKEKIVKSISCLIEDKESECRQHIEQYIDNIIVSDKVKCNVPSIVFIYEKQEVHWKFKAETYSNKMLTELYENEWNNLQSIFTKMLQDKKVSVKDFDKYVFWLNGLDELNKYPPFMERIIRDSINTNILFIGMITSELRDSSIRKAFDYAFITGNVERFYDMFNIKYTKQPIGAITINFGIQSQGISMPFKMYRTKLDTVETPNFLNELLEELI